MSPKDFPAAKNGRVAVIVYENGNKYSAEFTLRKNLLTEEQRANSWTEKDVGYDVIVKPVLTINAKNAPK